MSTSTTPEKGRTRSRILIALGIVIVVATYIYLVVGGGYQTVAEGEVANLSEQGALIAIIGYLLGAVLIAVGAIHRLTTVALALIPVAIALNIVVGQLVAVLGLPIYLDSIGTVLVSALAGPAAGVVTGILTNVIWGLLLNPISLPFAVVQVVIGVMAGYAARWGFFRMWYLAPVAGAVTGIVAAIISAPIAAYVFGGATSVGTGALVGAFQEMGNSLLASTTFQGLLSDPLDKAITFTIVVLILAALPGRFRQRFPFAREYNVFGRKTPTLTPSSAAAAPSAAPGAAPSVDKDDSGAS
ncbi:MAG TPA: ECF transporter S component [Terrimesophilobacter sp.]|nr:ECF transporter S component [Terrimesophilobacter sp.]HRQ01133.1 ECF transporter S component [Terrimesophilobacter sp.]